MLFWQLRKICRLRLLELNELSVLSGMLCRRRPSETGVPAWTGSFASQRVESKHLSLGKLCQTENSLGFEEAFKGHLCNPLQWAGTSSTDHTAQSPWSWKFHPKISHQASKSLCEWLRTVWQNSCALCGIVFSNALQKAPSCTAGCLCCRC